MKNERPNYKHTKPHSYHVYRLTHIHFLPKLTQLLYHAILYAQSKLSEPQQPVLLDIEESVWGYVINSIEGHVKRVPAIRIMVTTQQEAPTGEKNILQQYGTIYSSRSCQPP